MRYFSQENGEMYQDAKNLLNALFGEAKDGGN